MSHMVRVFLGNEPLGMSEGRIQSVVDTMVNIKEWCDNMGVPHLCHDGEWTTNYDYWLTYEFPKASDAMIFKLAWGGQ